MWQIGFRGVRGVRPGMSVAAVARRWHVKFRLAEARPPGCVFAAFRNGRVTGSALFQDGRFDAAWFTRGVRTSDGATVGTTSRQLARIYGTRLRRVANVYDPTRPLYDVRGGSGYLIEFTTGSSKRVARIGFGDRYVLVQEGCG